MDDTSTKISFIPKGSLVREESFLERPRSRSAITIVAIFLFTISIVGYGGLYFYNSYLEGQIAARLDEIQKIQSVFNGSTQVERAKGFRSRVDIVQGLLASHIAVSPILKFISENTLGDIMYDKFTFTRDGNDVKVKLSGEAPTYAALAYQKQVLKVKTKELVGSEVSDVALTQFGTVAFALVLSFNPAYLLPSTISAASPIDVSPSVVQEGAPVLPPAVTFAPLQTGTSSAATSTVVFGAVSTSTNQNTAGIAEPVKIVEAQAAPVVPAESPSLLSRFWSWFKFW